MYECPIYLSVLYVCYNAMSVPTVSIESTVQYEGVQVKEKVLSFFSRSPSLQVDLDVVASMTVVRPSSFVGLCVSVSVPAIGLWRTKAA